MSDLVFGPKPAGGEIVFGADAAKGAKLVFQHEQRNSPDLVFGAGGTAHQGTPDPAYVYLDVDTGAITAELRLAVATPVSGEIDCGEVGLDLRMRWDSNTYRFEVARTRALWQEGLLQRCGMGVAWSSSQHRLLGTNQRWQQAIAALAGLAGAWGAASRHLSQHGVRWQMGASTQTCSVWRWQAAQQRRCTTAVRHQQGQAAHASRALRWQGAIRRQVAPDVRWQMAQPRLIGWATRFGPGVVVAFAPHIRWQAAMQAPPGISPRRDGRPPVDGDGYQPPRGGAVDLLFCRPAHGTGSLIFGFCRKRQAGKGDPKLIIPKLTMYTHINEARATLWPQGDPLVLFDCNIETDAGGYGWHLRASGPSQLMEQLAPRKDGTPVRVRVELCGLAWVFVVGLRQRTRQFGRHVVTFDASSPTCLLDAPHAQPRTFTNAEQQTAQQLALAALEHSGVTLDWRIEDWLVPAQVWSHQGTPLSAVLRVADAAGAVVQSHRTADTLIVQPRYAAMPWEWANTAPALQLPIGYCTTESLNEQRQPLYNAIYTSGTVAGQVHRTKRAGTAGDLEAAMVTDALLTERAAHLQRARSILGAAGWQAQVGLALPLDTAPGAPGLLDVGTLVEIDDTDGAWRGLVRGVSISAGARPGVRQSIKLERHLHTEAA